AELPGFGETTRQKLCDIIAKRAAKAGSFQVGQIAAEAETLRSIWRHRAALCRSIWLEVIGGEKRSYMIWIFWWRRRTPRTSRNFSFPIRWWNRLSRRGPPNRAYDCDRECSAICEW